MTPQSLQFKDNLIGLFKLKLFLTLFPLLNGQNPFQFEVVLNSKSFNRPSLFTQHVLSRNNFAFSDSTLNKYLFSLISEQKRLVFKTNMVLSRFTSLKHRLVDNRLPTPRLTEFAFNLDPLDTMITSMARTKVAVNLFINSINYFSHVYSPFTTTYNLKRIKPYQKLSSIILRKLMLKHFSFNSYTMVRKASTFFASFMFIRFFALFQFFLLLNQKFFIFRKIALFSYNFAKLGFHYFNDEFVFYRTRGNLRQLAGLTGMVTFIRPGVDILNVDREDPEAINETLPVRHFAEYYQFSNKEVVFQGGGPPIRAKKVGKSTLFFWITKKMLKRKFSIKNPVSAVQGLRVRPLANRLVAGLGLFNNTIMSFKNINNAFNMKLKL